MGRLTFVACVSVYIHTPFLCTSCLFRMVKCVYKLNYIFLMGKAREHGKAEALYSECA